MKKDKRKQPIPTTLSKKSAWAVAFACLMAFSSLMVVVHADKQGPQGNDGANGANGKDGATWYSGTEVTVNQGAVGDFFFDTDDFDIYQKTADGWSIISNIKGAQGEKGTAGIAGVGIEKVEYDANGNLVVTFTDGTTQTLTAPAKHEHTFGEWINNGNGMSYHVCTDCAAAEWKENEETPAPGGDAEEAPGTSENAPSTDDSAERP